MFVYTCESKAALGSYQSSSFSIIVSIVGTDRVELFHPTHSGEKDVQLVLRLIYGWTVVHGHRLLRSSLCRWSQCWCSNYPRVTTWNQQHTTQFATQSGCRHASRVSWSLGPDLRQLFECHRNNVNDVQPSHAPTQSQRCCNVWDYCLSALTCDWTKHGEMLKSPELSSKNPLKVRADVPPTIRLQ